MPHHVAQLAKSQRHRHFVQFVGAAVCGGSKWEARNAYVRPRPKSLRAILALTIPRAAMAARARRRRLDPHGADHPSIAAASMPGGKNSARARPRIGRTHKVLLILPEFKLLNPKIL